MRAALSRLIERRLLTGRLDFASMRRKEVFRRYIEALSFPLVTNMHMHPLRAAILGLLGAILLLLPAASAHAAFPDRFDIDTYSTAPGPFVNPTSGVEPLVDGVAYVAQVQGTMSLWTASQWSSPRWRTCNGEAEQAPVIASGGKMNGPVGIDAETRYAPLVEAAQSCPTSPRGLGNFELSTSGEFTHPAPLATSDPATHTYRYPIRGSGRALAARFIDPAPQDNYGVFRVTVAPPVPADCANGGFTALGFPDEATCVGRSSAASTSNSAASAAASTSLPVPARLDSSAGAAAGAAAVRICSSRRAFAIRIVESKRRPIRSARVSYLGRTVSAKRRRSDKRLVATIDLRKRPVRRFSVQVSVKYRNGTSARGVRKYYTCTAKRAGGQPRL